MLESLRKKPVLVGGLGLAGAWLIVEGASQVLADLGGTLTLGAVAVAGGLWLSSRLGDRAGGVPNAPAAEPTDRAALDRRLGRVKTMLDWLAEETAGSGEAAGETRFPVAAWRDRVAGLAASPDRDWLTLAVAGAADAGKTSAIAVLSRQFAPAGDGAAKALTWRWQELPAIAGEVAGPEGAPDPLPDAAIVADAVLFLLAGDMTASERSALAALAAAEVCTLVAFNQQDRYLPRDREAIAQTLKHQLADLLPEPPLPLVAAPAPIVVRRHGADGSATEFWEQPEPDAAALTARLADLRDRRGRELQLAAALRQARLLAAEVQQGLNAERRDRALPAIEQGQWIAAAAAFANPLPALDLLATTAISGQLVMDLGTIYRQSLSWEGAQATAKTLAELILKLGLVELSTQALSAALKANAATYAVGGLIQGASAAYLTRVAGLTLVEAFEARTERWAQTGETGPTLAADRLGDRLKAAFDRTRQAANLQALARQAADRLLPGTAVEA